MKASKLLLILFCAFFSISSFAHDSNACSPAGTWYGGSDYKYLLTIIPTTEDRFTIRYEAVFANATFGDSAWTSWPGELKKQKNGHYVGQMVSMYTTSSDTPPLENAYELDAIRESVEFVDCDNIKATIYFFGAYLDLTKLPFLDPPDFSYLPPGETIIENYRRVPLSAQSVTRLQPRASKPGRDADFLRAKESPTWFPSRLLIWRSPSGRKTATEIPRPRTSPTACLRW